MATGATICAVMLISLFLSSFFISYFAIEAYGVKLNVIDIPNDINLPQTQYSDQDFTTNSYNSTVVYLAGDWNYEPNVGLVLTTEMTNGEIPYVSETRIIKDAAGMVTNTYVIKNYPKEDYYIILKHGYGNGAIAVLAGTTSNIIKVGSDGFHVPRSFVLINPATWQGGDIQFVSYPGANQIEDVVITTEYNTDTYQGSITFNGQKFNIDTMNGAVNVEVFLNPIYGGVMSNSVGFALQKYNSPNEMILGIFQPTASDYSILSLMAVMVKVVGFGLPPEIMPVMLQLLLIRSQEAVLIIGIAAFLRGI